MAKEIKQKKTSTINHADEKKRLHQICLHAVNMRIQRLKSAQLEIQDSANEETKSSAGDKYETGRSMAQLEIDKLRGQILDAENQLHVLNSIKEAPAEKIQLGSLVYTSQGGPFYLAVSLGPVEVQLEKYYVVSMYSPIGKALTGKKKGEIAEFSFKKAQVLDIY